ncbi:TPA: hypothetical protein NP126_003098 [Escherichia coli]|nr:hypothetical protein [Escherichia coli]
MLRQFFLLTATTFLCGCGYHFGNDVDAYDLLPRPVGSKKFEIVAPDDSIQSRMFAARFASGLTGKGFNISSHQPEYILRFSYSKTQENLQYSELPVTGITGYVIAKKTTRKDKHGQTETDYDYKPVSGIVGTETVSQRHFWRRLDVEVYPAGKNAQQVLKVSMQSNAPIPSDSVAYSAMIDALTGNLDAPLRSGNYVASVPWN